MVEMCSLVHNDYDRISDRVLWLGYMATLNFNVDLFYLRKDNKSIEKVKENFHKEYIYKTNPDDESYRVKIVRDFNYYFSIEYNNKDIKEKVNIGPESIYFLIFNIKKVIQWFIGENGVNTVFSKRDGKLFIPTHPEPIRVNLAFNNYIEFEAAIGMNNGYETIGVNVYLNSDGVFFFMTSDTVFSLYHMISTCNMYTLAQNMLNYVQRPEYGTNSYNLTFNNSTQKNNNSFFSMVGAKSE